MLRLALLSSDNRMSHQIQTWSRELADVKIERFASLEEFQAYVENPFAPKEAAVSPDASAAKTEEGVDGVDYEHLGAGHEKAPYRLVILDFEMLPAKPFQWIMEMRKTLKLKGLSSEDLPTRVFVMAFEGGGHKPETLRNDAIDDLILKPLDRSLFLQKVEILIADNPKVKPSFLFRQTTKQRIEVGKDGVIDEISEFGVAIRNPAPLIDGLYAAIHSTVFGEGDDGRVLGRVYQSVKHPTHEGEYLVRFTYFGINSRQQANVKKYVRAQHMPVRTRAPQGAAPRLKDVPQPVKHRVAVIDMNPLTFTEIKSALETNFKGVSVQSYPSYSKFLMAIAHFLPHGEKAGGAKAHGSQAAGATGSKDEVDLADLVTEGRHGPAWPGGGALTVILNTHQELVRFEPALRGDEKILGKAVDEWKERPTSWVSAVEDEDVEEFEEFLAYVTSGAHGYQVLRMTDEDQRTIYLEAKGTLEKTGEADGVSLLRIEYREIDRDKWQSIAQSGGEHLGPEAFRFDAIYVDGAVLRAEPGPWLEGLQELMTKAGILHPGVPFPKIFVMADDHSRVKPESYRIKGITDFSFKPLDRKYVVQKAAALIPKIEYTNAPEVSPFIPCEMPVRLAKDVLMDELSEYGLSIVHATPFRERVFMRFFSPLFGQGEGVIGRCVFCEKDKEKDAYHCHFTFYGSSDDLLRKIRAWIREDYVHKKDGTAG